MQGKEVTIPFNGILGVVKEYYKDSTIWQNKNFQGVKIRTGELNSTIIGEITFSEGALCLTQSKNISTNEGVHRENFSKIHSELKNRFVARGIPRFFGISKKPRKIIYKKFV